MSFQFVNDSQDLILGLNVTSIWGQAKLIFATDLIRNSAKGGDSGPFSAAMRGVVYFLVRGIQYCLSSGGKGLGHDASSSAAMARIS
jgi:hypothetical protein